MSVEPETRQQLLELLYGLLTEEEAVELRAKIAADEELARAYAEAEQTAGLFQEAVRLESPLITLRRPEKPVTVPFVRTDQPQPSGPKPAGKPRKSVQARDPWARWANWAIGTAAAVLLIVSLGGYLYHRGQVAEIAGQRLRIMLTGPSRLQAGVANRYSVNTTAVTGEPLSAQIEFALYAPDGEQLMAHKEKTDEEGRLEITVGPELKLPPQARLQVRGAHGDKIQDIDTRLDVVPPGHATQLSLDKPLYRPGETVRYRSLTLSRFGLAADRDFAVHFEILDSRGSVVPGSAGDGVTIKGVGCGEFTIDEGLAGGEYTLVAKSLDGAFPDERRKFILRAYRLPRLKKELEFNRDSYSPGDKVVADFSASRAEGGPATGAKLRILATVDDKTVHQAEGEASPSGTFAVEFNLPREIERGDGQLVVVADDGGSQEPIAKTIPINLGKLRVSFYPEGGELVPGLENRVYFSARDPLGKPVHVGGRILDSQGRAVAPVETAHEGMGVFTMTPSVGEKYRLKFAAPAGAKEEPALPAVSAEQKVLLTAGVGVFDAGKPMEFLVRTAESGLPLIVSAWCRGVLVGQQPLVTQVTEGENGNSLANPVVIPLDDTVGGVIRLTVYDYRATPPKPLAERLVYRRPARRLNVQMAEHPRRYAPGEKVELALVVTDETGKPATAALGVSVVDDALLNLAEDKTGSMTTHFLLGTEVENPQDLEKIDFYLSDDPKATLALDLLLGTQGWRRFVEKTLEELKQKGGQSDELARLAALGGESDPPAVFDNLAELQTHHKESLDAYRAKRTKVLNALVTLSFFGSAGLVFFVAMLSLMSIPCGVRGWAVSLATAGVCLFIGLALLNPPWGRRGTVGEVAFASFDKAPLAAETQAAAETGPTKAVPWDREMAVAEAREQKKDVGLLRADKLAVADEKADRLVQDKFAAGRNLMLRDMDAADGEAGKRKMARRARGPMPAAAPMFGAMGGAGVAADWAEEQKQEAARPMGMALKEEEAAAPQRFVVREYRHEHVRQPAGVRSDFAETLYWHPLLVSDADGRASVKFDLADSVTTFRVLADAHADGGRIGSGSGEVISRIPFNLEPKLPLEVNAGDRIELPLAVVNDTDRKLPVELNLVHGGEVRLDGDSRRKLELAAGQRGREFFALDVVGQKGQCPLTFRGTTGSLADAVERKLVVVPPGFPNAQSYAGEIDGKQEVAVRLPETWVPGSLEVELNVFPSNLANIQKGLDGMLQEPNGCFEQASSSNYPNVMTLSYMQEHNVADPTVTRRARDLLKSGYGKLTGYESPTRGYEWFGGDPGHEALTAYGLMEFRDMAAVYEVDPAMIERTAKWILDRRDGKGGFQRNPKALDSFGAAPQEITNAYITWALAEAGQKEIDPEAKLAIDRADKSEDPYLVALAASAALKTGHTADGRRLLDKLTKAQTADGQLEGKNGSITRSGGLSLSVETTALATLAWLKLPGYAPQANRAIQWLTKNRQGPGGFGSTQATVLALKALTEHGKANRRVVADGKLIVHRGDVTVAEQAFNAGHQETIRAAGLEARLEPGENRLKFELTGDNKMPYTLNVSYRSMKPASDEACPVRLSARLAQAKIKAGATVALEAKLVNTTDKGQPMTVTILGLPAGLEVRPDQLEDIKKAGTIDAYETRAREVIFYWRSLAPKKEVSCKLDLIAAVPGKYTGPASRAYLYYTAEQKQWADPLSIEIGRE